MSGKSSAIPATILIDPAFLAVPSPAANAELLADIRALLVDVRAALADANALAVDGNEAARRLSISRRHLQDIDGLKSFTIGSRRLWAVADLHAFIEKQKGK